MAKNEGAKEKKDDIESEERLVKRVEEAARKGAKEGASGMNDSFTNTVVKGAVAVGAIALIVIVAMAIIKSSIEKKWDNFVQETKEQFSVTDPAENQDLVLENDGFLGYTAADFAEAILGDSSRLKKLEVFSQEIVDVATVTDTGLANIKIFEKSQMITYHGTATYTVDLSRLSSGDVSLDQNNKKVTLYIPHSVMEAINIPEDKMEFGDVTGGWLAFGEIKLTPEQNSEIQAAARKKMEQKLVETKATEQADRFARMSVWEMYQTVVSEVSPEYTFEVKFRN